MKYLYTILFLISGCISVSSQDSKTFYLQARVDRILNNSSSALQELNKAIDADQTNYRYYLERGMVNYAQKFYQQAISDLHSAEKLNPGSGSLGLAKTYAILGDEDNAFFYLSKHLRSSFKLPKSEITGDPSFDNIQYGDKWFEFWQQKWYSDEEIKYDHAKQLLLKGNEEEALIIINQVLSKNAMYAPAYLLRAKYYLADNQNALSIADINTCLELQPGSKEALILRAKIHIKNEEFKKALPDLNSCIQTNPEIFELYLLRSRTFLGLKEILKAQKDVDLYLSYFPDNTEANRLYADIMVAGDNPQKALMYYNKLLLKDQSDPGLFKSRGEIYMKTKTYSAAVYDFGMSLDLNPQDGKTYLEKGLAHYYLHEIDKACYHWKKAKNLGEITAVKYLLENCRNQ